MIGNAAHAATIAALPMDTNECFSWETGEYIHTPEGFTYLGSGAYRAAFLGPDNVVYKREFVGHMQQANCNIGEARIFSTDRPEGFRFAACTLFGEVLAMEYVEDDGSDCDESYMAMKMYMRSRYAYMDCHADKREENWFAVNGVAVLTDFCY
jgi:hypothetical protein